MEDELKNFIKVWITTILCLSYCHYIVSRLIPKGLLRLISLLPVFYFFITTPLTLHSFHLCGPTTFFLVWLGIFKLLLFSFNLGPLSPPPASLFHFISIACLPIKIKPPNHKTTQKPSNPIGQSVTQWLPNKSIVVAVKALLLGMIIHTYEYRPHLHPYVILALYCCHMYLALELILVLSATPARALFRFELEPQSNEPYLSTSLQDFWGRRWNLMVTNILRPTVYDPTRRVCARVFGKRWARLPAVMATFAVSGLMHEVIYYYLTRVQPTWEVTWFFVLHGACVVVEVEVKKAVTGRWRLHPVVSRPLTLVFLAVTGNWLFFPQLLRNGVDAKAIGEYAIMVDFVKANLPHLSYWPNKT
ncbi:putative long-chain-alcohol O-fatty-acyltransferase [Rosa chinensis]|uniref:Putative long-chain-alcohol O-fatty-acyltransferase n=1 Tax=Rosa chinensis TaxID=74649 RepID=A0A2P6RT05_ROSCH|nr:probable long-chain-alcohol O-fatty-acyltransferase 5 [Rosa chinensis]PRQ49545.1 putative long-chain-alcohol O-fatty-acyltransferase [Rosa chinensis]